MGDDDDNNVHHMNMVDGRWKIEEEEGEDKSLKDPFNIQPFSMDQ